MNSFQKSDGITPSEQYLKRLCDKSFLSLWSYAGIFRDQGQTTAQRVGKEICDLLVVFQNHVLIFSDKYCEFPSSGNIDLNWSRWFRRAVENSARQVYGAERWIQIHPDRLFLDRECTLPFPVPLPDPSRVKFHRIVVAHGVSEACERHFGGGSSGSLIIDSSMVGNDHYTVTSPRYRPFHIGQIDPSKGYIHVLDDTTLDVVLETLDTVNDFVAYLEKKERFLTGKRAVFAMGEEDLLAFYLQKLNKKREHDFVVSKSYDTVLLEEGFWADFITSPERVSQITADRISYEWDQLIERFAEHIVAGNRYQPDSDQHVASFSDTEQLLRFMAAEGRTRRRILAQARIEIIAKTPKAQRGVRVILPTRPEQPHYVFVAFPLPDPSWKPGSAIDYRGARARFLEACCLVTRLRFPAATDIVGIATEPGLGNTGRSEDAMYFNGRVWNDDLQRAAIADQEALGLLLNPTFSQGSYLEYPSEETKLANKPQRQSPFDVKGRDRNAPCFCGSGKKTKYCCGPLLRNR